MERDKSSLKYKSATKTQQSAAMIALAKRNSYVPHKNIIINTDSKEIKETQQFELMSNLSSVRNTTKSVVSRGSEQYKVAGQYGHKIMVNTGIIKYERKTSTERGSKKIKKRIDPQNSENQSLERVLEGTRIQK